LLFWLHFSTSTFSPITIFCILSYSTPSSRLLGKPCAVSSTSHSPSLLEPVPIQASLTWSHCVSFRLRYSPACNSSQYSSIFYFIDTFSTHFPEKKTKGEVFHIKSYSSLSSFAGMCAHRHSVLKGPWQFPFPVLAGLKVPVYKVKFVIRTFLPTTRKLLSSAPAMPCHITGGEFLLSSLHFNFRGQDIIFLPATSTPLPCS
jgi:hypothetical protein